MSEIAEIRARIDQEIAAMMLALRGYGVIARHDIINHRYTSLEKYMNELTPYLGEEGALDAVIKALDDLDTDRPSQQI